MKLHNENVVLLQRTAELLTERGFDVAVVIISADKVATLGPSYLRTDASWHQCNLASREARAEQLNPWTPAR